MNAHQRGQRFKPPNPNCLGVAGAGAMGSGIALVALLSDFKVVLQDVQPEVLAAASRYIESQLEKRKRLLDLSSLSLTTELGDFSQCSVVIEAVPENLTIKQDLFARLSEICPPPAVLATNTSTLSVTAIASSASDPSRIAGMHFFNPAAVMPLVEIVTAAQSSPETIAELTALAKHLGKQPVIVKDTPGFLVNRIARPFYGEALRILAEGAASHETIDAIVRLGGGFKMGPFQLMDLIGIDVNFAATRSVFEQTFYEPRYRPHPIQAQMVAQQAYGRKTGRGFYSYDLQGNLINAQPDPVPLIPGNGNGKQITLIPGSFAPDLEPLLHSCGWHVTPISSGLQASSAVMIAACHSEDLDETLHALDLALPPAIPIIVQCNDLSLSEIAHLVSHPERLVGFDSLFLSHGSVVTLSTLPAVDSSAATAASEIFRTLGKHTYPITDSPALVLPRIVCALINEAAFALGERVASAETIDLAMKLGTNYPYGPIEWGRQIGYHKIAAVMEYLFREYGEERYRLAPLLKRWSRERM